MRFQPRADLEVHTGDVLLVRGNVLSLVGACAHVAQTRPKLMMPDLIFRAEFRDDSPIVPAYLTELMRTTHLRRQMEDAATGTSPTMTKVTKPSLLALRLPLPPLATQQVLVAAIATARAEAARERAAAELESALLGSPPTL
jgi:type I restriction enzyme S subunit